MCVKHLAQSDKYCNIANICNYDVLSPYCLRDRVLNALPVFTL